MTALRDAGALGVLRAIAAMTRAHAVSAAFALLTVPLLTATASAQVAHDVGQVSAPVDHQHDAATPAGQSNDAAHADHQTTAGGHDHAAMVAAAADAEIGRLLAQMDSETGDAKVAVMATLVKTLVEERKAAKPGAAACPMCAAKMNTAGGTGAGMSCSMMAQK